MHFLLPMFPAEFELPDDWWAEAGMTGFTPIARSFRSTAEATLILLRDIEPPFRNATAPKDWRGFRRADMISVFSGIATGAEIEPVPVTDMPQPREPSDPSLSWTVPRSPFRYRVKDGYHRFYASVAAGFECLPVLIS